MTETPLVGMPIDVGPRAGEPNVARKLVPMKRSRRMQRLTRRDKIVLSIMVAVPTMIELLIIWIPTVLSVLLSFTRWNGLALSNIRNAGLTNYTFVTQTYPPFWPAVRHNIIWLLFLGLIA